MNTAFGGNRVGGIVTLDIKNAYPVGLLAGLGPKYNDQQELTLAQLRYTALQSDLAVKEFLSNVNSSIDTLNTALIAPKSFNSQVESIAYINSASQINDINRNTLNVVNIAYTNAKLVAKVCSDAAYSGYLTTEAYNIFAERSRTLIPAISLGKMTPSANPRDTATLSIISTSVANNIQGIQNTINDASNNVYEFINKTQSLIDSAVSVSSSVAINLYLQFKFTHLVNLVANIFLDVISEFAGKETLITQYKSQLLDASGNPYGPKVPLQSAINVASYTLTCINTFIAKFNTPTDYTKPIDNLSTLVDILEASARKKDEYMYLTRAVMNGEIAAASTIRGYGGKISVPNVLPFTPIYVSNEVILDADNARIIALAADKSASNARAIVEAIKSLRDVFLETLIPETLTQTIAADSSSAITSILDQVNIITSNSSPIDAVLLTSRVNNFLYGKIQEYTDKERVLLSSSEEASLILNILNNANTIPFDTLLNIQSKSRILNDAKEKSQAISDKLLPRLISSNNNANNLVTPQRIATQTFASNKAGAKLAYNNSLLQRLSKDGIPSPPKPYNSFKAGIRAQTLPPIANPNIQQLIERNKIQPVGLNSLRTISDTQLKLAQNVQYISDQSKFSFRQ